MKKIFILGLLGTITMNAYGVTCGPQETENYIGYAPYRSEYVYDYGRCQSAIYWYFYEFGTSNLCSAEYTRDNIDVTVFYATDKDNDLNKGILGTTHDSIYGYQTCDKCKSGMTQILIARLTNKSTGAFYNVYGCSKCEETEWELDTSNRSREVRQVCDGADIDTTTTEYRCAAGFYGDGTNCEYCSPMADSSGPYAYPTSIPGENKTIKDCYIEPGTYHDATGTFELSGQCYHD